MKYRSPMAKTYLQPLRELQNFLWRKAAGGIKIKIASVAGL